MPTRPSAISLGVVAALLAGNAASARKPQPTCFLLQELGGKPLARVNPELCARPLSPASTFKIPHALIALETGVLPDEHVFWSPPKPQSLRVWNRDHDLASAIHYSALWYFQRIAGLVGPRREAEWLARLDYGNRAASGDVQQFWINGVLRISADQQLQFLERFFAGSLQASARSQSLVKKLLEQEPGRPWAAGKTYRIDPWPRGAVLRAKSGTTGATGGVSWYVGELERGGKQYVFVTCVQGKPRQGSAARETFRRLKAAGLL